MRERPNNSSGHPALQAPADVGQRLAFSQCHVCRGIDAVAPELAVALEGGRELEAVREVFRVEVQDREKTAT